MNSTSNYRGGVSERPRTLLEVVEARIPSRLKLASTLLKYHAKSTIHNVTVESVMHGMRGIPCVLWEISALDENGVRYHGKTLQELGNILPKWRSSEVLSPEAVLWYLFSATVPTRVQLEGFASDLVRRAELPEDVAKYCDNIPTDQSPAMHMVMSLSTLSRHSKFTAAVENGVAKHELWKYAFEDALDIAARLPALCARIHSNIYRQGRHRDVVLDPSLDLAANFAKMMGRSDDIQLIELTRLYWALHMDHGPSASAHTMRICSSAWTDAYLTVSSGYIAAIGTLHVTAIRNSIRYNLDMYAELGSNPSYAELEAYVCRTLSQGAPVPGYGHAVLRRADPRLDFITQFVASRPSAGSEGLFSLLDRVYKMVPDILRTHVPRMKNHAPNVDALSGCVLHAVGLEDEFLLPFMGCSRGTGFMVQMVWDRALGLPIERPLSMTMEEMMTKLEPPVREIQPKL